jgi:UDP-2-acetamido-3-amino-2,3-dideoxy-glucuronate N-acetyltransferase
MIDKNTYVHPLSEVQAENIGKDTKIWQYVVVLKNAKIGSNCNINCHCFIENDVIIGNNVTIKSGVYVWDGLRIEDNVFIGPNVTFINDKFPKSKNSTFKLIPTVIKKGASIGAGSIIMGGTTIGENSMIGAGSLVTKDILPNALYYGNPAKFIKKI